MIVLEHVPDDAWDTVRRNFEALALAVLGNTTGLNLVDSGGVTLGIRTGSATAAWTASATSATLTITHGLTVTPTWIGFTTHDDGFGYHQVSKGASSFQVRGFLTAGGSVTTTRVFDWVVIG